MSRDRRRKRDLHALNADGMVLCNPHDKEAAHRAEMEGIATEDLAAVTCRKCLSLLFKREGPRMQQPKDDGHPTQVEADQPERSHPGVIPIERPGRSPGP
jgi:hypothetical protein